MAWTSRTARSSATSTTKAARKLAASAPNCANTALANVRIVSSQFCRALETGKLLGVGPVGGLAALNQIYAADVDKLTAATAQVKAYMHEYPAQPARGAGVACHQYF